MHRPSTMDPGSCLLGEPLSAAPQLLSPEGAQANRAPPKPHHRPNQKLFFLIVNQTTRHAQINHPQKPQMLLNFDGRWCIYSNSYFLLASEVATRSRASARIEIGFLTSRSVDISICHLQVSQSQATKSGFRRAICSKSGFPIACETS